MTVYVKCVVWFSVNKALWSSLLKDYMKLIKKGSVERSLCQPLHDIKQKLLNLLYHISRISRQKSKFVKMDATLSGNTTSEPSEPWGKRGNHPPGLENTLTLFKPGRGQIFPMPLRISNSPSALYCSKFALDCCRLSLSEWTIITFNRITWSGCDNLGWTIPAVWLWPFVLFVVYYSITLPICKWAPLPNCSK